MRKFIAMFVVMLMITSISPKGTAVSKSLPAHLETFNSQEENETIDYHTYETMTQDLHRIQALHSEIAKLYDLTSWTEYGATWQGRAVWGMKISNHPEVKNDPQKPKIVIVGNHHAREWMTFEVPYYLIEFLVENYGKEPEDDDNDGVINEDPIDSIDNDGDGLVDEDEIEARVSWIVDNREIWIIPMLNPDGTTVDQSGTSWRKNCRDNFEWDGGGFNPENDGVDLNRNYPYKWDNPYDPETGKTLDSDVPQSETYRGPPDNYDDDGDSIIGVDIYDPKRIEQDPDKVDEDPVDGIDNDGDGLIDEDKDGGFSEPETMAMEELMKILDSDGNHYNGISDVAISFSFHSYGEYVIWPWGYTVDPTPHEGLFVSLGQVFMNFTGYRNWWEEGGYYTSGDFDDWMYGSHGVMAFTFELNNGDEGGFHPPPELIIPTFRKLLPCNLFAIEYADVIRTAKELHAPSLDIGLPKLIHEQERSSCLSSEKFKVTVKVENISSLNENSLVVRYKVDDEYKELRMTKIVDDEFVGYIPKQKGGRTIEYYFIAKDIYGNTIFLPRYAPYESFAYYVDEDIGSSAFDIAAMIIMMISIFGIVYTGLAKCLHIAINAERRKMSY